MGLLEYIIKLRPSARHATILLLGLDGAGKSTVLRQLSDEDVTTVTPTQGFCIKTLIAKGVKLNVWDMGGQRAVRSYWRQYFQDAEVLIFVVDAADPQRALEAKDQFTHLMEEEKISGVPVLIFANKQDLIGAMTPEDLSVLLDLDELRDRRWFIQGCSAKTGEGLMQGMNWVVRQVKH